jgi:hypothetical protein
VTGVTEQFTPGVINALHKNRKRDVCPCGFPMPVYPGRYPSTCPNCGKSRDEAKPVSDEPLTAPEAGNGTDD